MSVRNAKRAENQPEEQGIYDPYLLEKKIRMGMFRDVQLGGEAHWSIVSTWSRYSNPRCAQMIARMRAKRKFLACLAKDEFVPVVIPFRRPGGPVRVIPPKTYGRGEFAPPPPSWILWTNA